VFSSLPRLKFILSPPFFDIRIFLRGDETDFFLFSSNPVFVNGPIYFSGTFVLLVFFLQNFYSFIVSFTSFKILLRHGFLFVLAV
jgi:hypothetical protein